MVRCVDCQHSGKVITDELKPDDTMCWCNAEETKYTIANRYSPRGCLLFKKRGVKKVINCYSFDIDGTMEWGGGIIPSDVLRRLKRLGHVILGGSDHPEVTQRSEFQMNGIELDRIPMKSGLSCMKDVFPDCEHYYHIGDDETDIVEAKEAGFTYLTPEAFMKIVCEGGLIG